MNVTAVEAVATSVDRGALRTPARCALTATATLADLHEHQPTVIGPKTSDH